MGPKTVRSECKGSKHSCASACMPDQPPVPWCVEHLVDLYFSKYLVKVKKLGLFTCSYYSTSPTAPEYVCLVPVGRDKLSSFASGMCQEAKD